MADIEKIIAAVADLEAIADQPVHEEAFRLQLSGTAFSNEVLRRYRILDGLLAGQSERAHKLMVDGETAGDISDGEVDVYEGSSWSVLLGKDSLAKSLAARENEFTVLFFSQDRWALWAGRLNPFAPSVYPDPDFSAPVTMRVAGLREAFGGPSLWVLGIDDAAPRSCGRLRSLPAPEKVLDTIHLNADRHLQVTPAAWALTWGHLEVEAAKAWCLLSCKVLAATLVQELRHIDGTSHITLKGTKRLSLQLASGREEGLSILCSKLADAVEWVYAERAETRLRLIMDRLSIDVDPKRTLVEGMQEHLENALHQAQDSYGFVILDRKDAYYKELRDLMKDMKSQADMYAAKVRDLVNAVTRDTLGVLVLLGFSFLGKFDAMHVRTLLSSTELSLLLRCLAGYLLISFAMQLAAHWRDANLSLKESEKWLSVLQSYTSRADSQSNFLDLLTTRRQTLYAALALCGIIYTVLFFAVWNLQSIALNLLN